MTAGLWDRETFVEKLREIGACAYHDKHPFHVAMNEGRLSPEAVRGWVANRFYYQRSIPLKDAAILSNCPLPEVRRVWIHRIADHDGTVKNEGGIEAWLRLGEACSLSRDELMQDKNLQPGVRFASGCLREFRSQPPMASRHRLIAYRTFCPRFDGGAARGFRKILSLDRPATVSIISVVESLKPGAIRAKHLKSQSSTAIRPSCRMPRFVRFSSNAMFFGACSMQFSMLMPTSRKGFPNPEVFRSWEPPLLISAHDYDS